MEAIEVPNVNERRRIPMRAIRAVVKQIAEKFQPEKIVLFGSYAYGKPKPESDVDLLVVMETSLRSRQQRLEISRALSPRPFPLDIISCARLRNWRNVSRWAIFSCVKS